jgi:hypothetical protein
MKLRVMITEMNIYLKNIPICLICFFCQYTYGQSKKEKITSLISQNDSLQRVITNLSDENNRLLILNKTRETDFIELNKERTLLYNSLRNANHTIDSLNDRIAAERAVLKDSFYILLNKYRSGPHFPYRLKKPINVPLAGTFSSFSTNGADYILIDSTTAYLPKFGKVCFYFVTKIDSNIFEGFFQCPNDYGLIITDEFGSRVIYEDYWNYTRKYDRSDKDSIYGNRFLSLLTIGKKGQEKLLININSTGCGSGGTCLYFEILIVNGEIRFKKYLETSIGYSVLVDFPERDYYVILDKIDPDCHYGCPSTYSVKAFRVSDKSKILARVTKYTYGCLSDFDPEILLNEMDDRENVLEKIENR